MHSLLEGAGVMINFSLAAFLLILIRVEILNRQFNWAVSGFIALAIIGAFHASVEPGQSFVGLHSLGTMIGGLLFGFMLLPESLFPRRLLNALPVLSGAIALAVSLVLLSDTPSQLPMLDTPGSFSKIAVSLNLIGAIGFILAAIGFMLCKQQTLAHQPLAIMALLYATAAVLFEYSVLWDATWWLWHFLRFFALLLLLTHFFVWFLQQTRQTRQHAEQMESIAFKDTLTQLPNRAFFYQQLDLQIKLAKRHHSSLALLFIDLDRFKIVNDTLGHQVGDQLLTQVAGRLRSSLRESDLLARMGGDEFTVIINEHQTQATASKVAQHIIDTIKPPFEIQGHAIEIGASIGIAFYPKDAEDVHDLLRLADTAMYQAKSGGRNRYHIYETNQSSI